MWRASRAGAEKYHSLFALNHTGEPAWLRAGGVDPLTGARHPAGGWLRPPPSGVVVLRTPREAASQR